MKPKATAILALLGASLCATLFGAAAKRPAAQAAPAAPVVSAAPATGALSDLLSGRLYPNSLPIEQMTTGFHLVTLVDAQGHPATVATKGDTVTLAGESFLVAYTVAAPPTPSPSPAPAGQTGAAPAGADQAGTANAGQTSPPNTTAQLTLINMRYVQAMGVIRDLPTTAGGGTKGAETP